MTTQRGLLTSVATTELGTVLVDDALAGQTTLTVDWTAEFATTGGLLRLGETQLNYTSATDPDDDPSVITLRDPLPADVAAGESVGSLTAAGEPRFSVKAYVSFDEGAKPIPYDIASGLQGRITEDVPAGTPLDVDMSTGRVVGRAEVGAQLDGNSVWNPYLARRATTLSVPNATWTAVAGWTDSMIQGVIVELDGTVTIAYPGFYVIDASPTFSTNNSGSRSARIMVNDVQAGYLSIPADVVGSTDVPVAARRVLVEGDNIRLDVYQSSGAALNLSSSAGVSPMSLYRVSL